MSGIIKCTSIIDEDEPDWDDSTISRAPYVHVGISGKKQSGCSCSKCVMMVIQLLKLSIWAIQIVRTIFLLPTTFLIIMIRVAHFPTVIRFGIAQGNEHWLRSDRSRWITSNTLTWSWVHRFQCHTLCLPTGCLKIKGPRAGAVTGIVNLTNIALQQRLQIVHYRAAPAIFYCSLTPHWCRRNSPVKTLH